MSGKKGMSHYGSDFKKRIISEQESGASVNSLSKKYKVSRYAIQCWCGLRPENNRTKGISGRKLNTETPEQRIKELEIENDLLRSFLHAAGRM